MAAGEARERYPLGIPGQGSIGFAGHDTLIIARQTWIAKARLDTLNAQTGISQDEIS
jgi:hypothetical protein